MTIIEALNQAVLKLEKSGVESSRLEAELLLAHVAGMTRPQLQLEIHRQLEEKALHEFDRLLRQRSRRIPLQHLLGTVSFCGFELEVNRAVLIPRPETELLAEKAWQLANAMELERSAPPVIMDVGTGSGCLAIALAVRCPHAVVFASDLSSAALETASSNARRHALDNRIRFLHGDLFEPLPPGTHLDLVVSNPPYIPSDEIGQLAPEVRDHDPRLALDGGPDGLLYYRRLAVESRRVIRTGARMLVEIGEGQAPRIEVLFEKAGWKIEAVEQDYTKRTRFIQARWQTNGPSN